MAKPQRQITMTKRKLQITIPVFLLVVGRLLCGGEPVSGQKPAVEQSATGQPATEQEAASPVTQPEEPSPEAADEPTSKAGAEQPKDADKTAEFKAKAPESKEPATDEKPMAQEPVAEKPKDDDPPNKEPASTKPSPKRVIGATARIQELQSGFMFLARIDTGAKSCSLHVDELRIKNKSDEMRENIGKTIHFLLRNGKEKTFLAKAKIRSVVRIKNASGIERRYKVKMEFQCKNVKKRVFVTLSDRAEMKFPLLIGRNFLHDDFLVDVDINSTD